MDYFRAAAALLAALPMTDLRKPMPIRPGDHHQVCGRRTMLAAATLPKVKEVDDGWKKQLSPLSYDVTRRAGTEWLSAAN